MLAAAYTAQSTALRPKPSVAEGLPGFVSGSYQGLLAPAGTPKAVVDKLFIEVQRVIALPEIKERLITLGAEPSGMSPEQFAAWIKTEIPAFAKIVRDEKITAD